MRGFVVLAGILIAYALFRLLAPGIELHILQGYFFPVILLACCFVTIRGQRLPRNVLLLLIVIGTILVLNQRFHFFQPNGIVLVSRLSGDTDDADTRQFVQRIEQSAKQLESVAVLQQHFTELKNKEEAQQVLTQFPHVRAIVFGSRRWLQIQFPAPSHRPALGIPGWIGHSKALLITHVPSFGLSLDPAYATATFLAGFFAALESNDPVEQVRLLQIAGSYRAGWTVNAHVAYVKWLEATLILERYMGSDRAEDNLSEILCASTKLKEAQVLLMGKDNPLLLAAIINNRGIADTLLYRSQKQDTPTPSMIAKDLRQVKKLQKISPRSSEAAAVYSIAQQTRKALQTEGPRRKKRSKHAPIS